MKTVRLSFYCTCQVVVFTACLLMAAQVHAQQMAFSTDEFYKQGDRFSEKVSGFFRDLFRSEPRQPRPQQPAYQPQPSYQTQPNYKQAPSSSSTRRSSTSPVYREAPATSRTQSSPPPKTKSSGTATVRRNSSGSSETARRSTTTKSSSSNTPVYTTSKKSPDPQDETPVRRVTETATTSSKVKETVVSAPTTKTETSPSVGLKDAISPFAINNDTSDVLPMPKQDAPKEAAPPSPAPSTSTATTTTKQPVVPANQEFPTGTPGKRPGRVVSPYAPHNELDVRGLSSGSLALDPTTQKVFKVP